MLDEDVLKKTQVKNDHLFTLFDKKKNIVSYARVVEREYIKLPIQTKQATRDCQRIPSNVYVGDARTILIVTRRLTLIDPVAGGTDKTSKKGLNMAAQNRWLIAFKVDNP